VERGCKADHSPPSSAEIINFWRIIHTPPRVFTAWCLIKHGGQSYLFISQHKSSYATFHINECFTTLCLILTYTRDMKHRNRPGPVYVQAGPRCTWCLVCHADAASSSRHTAITRVPQAPLQLHVSKTEDEVSTRNVQNIRQATPEYRLQLWYFPFPFHIIIYAFFSFHLCSLTSYILKFLSFSLASLSLFQFSFCFLFIFFHIFRLS
jgi:hypothetical protein